MTIAYVERNKKGLTINCSGPDGNAFQLLRTASDLGKQMGWDQKQITKVLTEMKSSDYEHLILTFDKHFGWHIFYKLMVNLDYFEQQILLRG